MSTDGRVSQSVALLASFRQFFALMRDVFGRSLAMVAPRRRVPIRLAMGTATFVFVLVSTVLLLEFAPSITRPGVFRTLRRRDLRGDRVPVRRAEECFPQQPAG